MLLTPIICVAILAREWRWSELATLPAAFAALAAKGWSSSSQADVLVTAWPLTAIFAMGLGVCIFSTLAAAIHVKNRQRSTLFQIALMAIQATAGILVVYARLDARIASRTEKLRIGRTPLRLPNTLVL